ncbi:MAG TPA: hypothetical protein VEW03_08295, partial [Longimicrobiaceae bacterium]|nr:hypothetical protein [Longimicrobiaceae bacterium]
MPNPRSGTPAARGALLLLALAACGGGGDGPDARGGAAEGDGRPEPGGTAVLAESHDLERPMPLVWQSELDGDL